MAVNRIKNIKDNKFNFFKLVRTINTALAYIIFIVGALTQGVVVYLVILLITRSGKNRQRALRRSVQYSFKLFLWLCRVLRVFKVDFKDLKNLSENKRMVIVANHPSLVDYVIIMSVMNVSTSVMVKESLTQTFMKYIINHLGYFHNKEEAKNIEDIIERDGSVLIFPEGTRTKDFHKIHFVRGAANIALRKNMAVLPVFINCDAKGYLSSSFFSFSIPEKVPTFTVEIGEFVEIIDYLDNCKTVAIAARHLTQDLEQKYQNYININYNMCH